MRERPHELPVILFLHTLRALVTTNSKRRRLRELALVCAGLLCCALLLKVVADSWRTKRKKLITQKRLEQLSAVIVLGNQRRPQAGPGVSDGRFSEYFQARMVV